MSIQTISPKKLHELHERGEHIDLVDVRTPVEFRERHVAYSINRPFDTLDPQSFLEARNGSADRPLYLICRSGNRAAKAYQSFAACGFDNVVNVDGGVAAWDEAGLPVVRGKKAVSLERQVRIAAGSLAFVGSLLAWFVHPAFLIVPGFVGAGLVFAGVTDTCGMAMLLAKMPWNQVRCDSGSAAKAQQENTSCCA